MLKWADMKFGPVNLWSAPKQNIDFYRNEIKSLERTLAFQKLRAEQANNFIGFNECLKKKAEKRLKELEFIYYTRKGEFLK